MSSKIAATLALIFMCVMLVARGLQRLYETGNRGYLTIAGAVTLCCVFLIIAINCKEKK